MIDLAARDAADPLAHFREQFALPAGVIYLDGNSLGALPKAAPSRIAEVVEREWGDGLIASWNDAEWVTAPRRIGDKIARLIGARSAEVVACDSTSVNIFKALAAAVSLNSGRKTVLSETGNFPTDLYMMQGLDRLSGGRIVAKAVEPDAVIDAIDADTAVVLLTHVHYKTGAMRDMAATTAAIHAKGALAIWDLSHSVGAMPLHLTDAEADFAVGCGYKFLNGGPGAPAFLFVAGRHQADALPALSGWFGHSAPFAFRDEYEAAPGIERFLTGTPPIIGLAGLEVGVDLMEQADLSQIRAKSLSLAEVFEHGMEPLVQRFGFTAAGPGDPAMRGSHISYRHEHGYAIMQALKARGVIGDFRDPDVMRFGLTPLYLSHADIARAVAILAEVMETGAWDRAEYRVRAAVT
ncbi:kynureninase [Tsuneonella suprasediminis]|uniref:Kynureninase n=1 Tax=Tsuneonella suprasediminis TaxID=2306996 RepID=A0A419R2T8_9SPHN|nr:kynureninase [Tsuneonella suprasediminis]